VHLLCSSRHSIYGPYSCIFNLQADLEKSKEEEVSKLKVALHDMEQRVEEVKAMQEQESAKKAVEEALAQEREKISLLTTEIEGLKVCFSPMNP
jgi:molybdopterin-guanine dinucleotide biosynthesis protein A